MLVGVQLYAHAHALCQQYRTQYSPRLYLSLRLPGLCVRPKARREIMRSCGSVCGERVGGVPECGER